MKTPSRAIESSAAHLAPRHQQQAKSNALSRLAFLFSTLALALSGFASYQVFDWQRSADSVGETAPQAVKAPQTETPQTAPSTNTSQPPTSQPGSLVQPALDGKAEVTILALERIQDPEQGTRDVVNVKLRLRRRADNVSAFDFVNVGGAIARQPGGGEMITYEPIDAIKHSTGPISLEGIRKGASADAYVWLRVPEDINKVDLYIPETEPFQAIEIAN